MNAFDRAKGAYHPGNSAVKTSKAVEYEAFARVTRDLQAALSDTAPFQQIVTAVFYNRRLWTVLAADVADPDNDLPAMLRARLFYLAEFTFQHSRKVMEKQASVEALIDVNTGLMNGLRARSEPS